MARWTRNIAFLLLIGTSLGNVGFLAGDLYRILGFLSFLVFVSTFLPFHASCAALMKGRLITAVFIAAAGILAVSLGSAGTFFLYLFISIALVVAVGGSQSARVKELSRYVVALACVGVLAELSALFPLLWHVKVQMAAAVSFAAEKIAEEDRNLGPTAMGLPLLASLIVLALTREWTAEHRQPGRWLLMLVILTATHLCYVVGLKYYASWLAGHRGHDWFLLNSQHLFILIGATVYTLIDKTGAARSFESLGRTTLGASTAALAGAFVVALAFAWSPAPSHRPARVMVYDAGYVNWRVPMYGVYGERSAGMFGMLPPALEAVGFQPVVSDDLALLDGPNPPQCVIMINIQNFFEDAEKTQIRRFVESGGGLLCLGDHTGVAGIRGPFNDLLEPAGIRFEFDSSTFFGDGWNDALEYRRHPMNRGVRSAEDYQMWVGATLGLDPSTRPVVVARYGYSDIGNPANIERSYLGDRRYNSNELLGDIVLVADARLGKGKVMVFGDTSGYQNLSLARALDTVVRSVDYLSRPGGFWPSIWLQVLVVIAVLLMLAGAVLYANGPIPLLAGALGFCLGGVVTDVLHGKPPALIPDFRVTARAAATSTNADTRTTAIIDASHGGHFTLRAWKDRSIGGLQLNLARNGYFPLIRDRFPYRDLESGAGLLVIVAPTREYSRREIDAVEKFLRQGGRAVVSVGFEEGAPSRTLLERFGVKVANTPVGRVEVEAPPDTLSVVIREGWPLRFDDGTQTEVLLSEWGLPLGIRKRIDAGELVVIGDSSFFHDVNLETLDRYFAGNIAFLKKITERSNTR